MAVSLTFDAEGCYRALIQTLIKVSDAIMEEFYNEAIAGLDAKGKEDSGKINAIWDETKGYVESQCKFYANALMQSFGTGSLADTSADSYWQEYTQSKLFNPVRKSTTIVGRKRGSYIDIYGKKQSSWGTYEGQDIEGAYIDYHGMFAKIVEPIQPKYSIQNAESWLLRNHQRRVEDRIEEELKRFFSEEAKSFFIEVNI